MHLDLSSSCHSKVSCRVRNNHTRSDFSKAQSGYSDRKITSSSYDQTPYWLLGKSNTGSSSPVRSRTWHLTKFNLIRSNLTKLGQIRSNIRIQPALAQAQLNQDQPDLTCSSLHLGLARLKPSSPHIELRLFRILRSHWDCNKRGLVKLGLHPLP